MLPTLRLLIAAMLATVVVLICGFGVFAAFRVSRDPIAHLPAAAAPWQMVAEAGPASVALSTVHDGAEEQSRLDVPANASQEPAPAAARSPGAAQEAEPSANRGSENVSVASMPTEQPTAASAAIGPLGSPSPNDGRDGDIAPTPASDVSPPGPIEAAAEPSATVIDQAIDAPAPAPTAAAEDAPSDQPTFAQTSASETLAALNPKPEPAAAAQPAVTPGAASRSTPETQPKPPLAAVPRSIGRAPPTITRDQSPRRLERPVRTLSTTIAIKTKRAGSAAARSVRAVRLTRSYYGQSEQSADQSYGYGQGDAEVTSADQQQAAVRRVPRPRAAALAARKVNSAVGGPFVKAGGK